MGSKKPREAREHSIEVKEQAARRLLAGESGTALSRELDIRRSVLYRWRDAYRAEGRAGLSRPRGRPGPGQAPPPKPAHDPRERRIAELERLLGRKSAEIDFLKQAFDVLNLALPASDAADASGSTRSSSGSSTKAGSASNDSARSPE